jgi:arabinofuranan 3-O-arabinosyltransferase
LFSIWFLKGLHAPIASSNMWFYDHVPGAWLFRDPSKLSLVLVLVFSLLGAIAVAEAGRASVEVRTVVAAVFVGGALIYAYPLLTGSVIADKRPLLPPSHVALPDNWPRAAAYLDSQSGPGKVVVLPRLDYYQTPTTWGYYGASFLHQLIQRPVIEPSPGGYFATGGVTALVDALQDGILNGKGDVTGVMQALGVRYVLLRRDLDTSFPGRSFVPPARLARALRQTPQLRHVRSFGFVDLYEARKVAEPEVYPATPIVQTRAANDASLYRALRLGPRTALVRNAVQDKLAGVPTGAVHLLPELRGRVTLTVEQRKRDTVVRIERPASRPRILRYPRVAYPLRVVLGTTRLVVDDATPATITSAPKFGRIYRFAPVQLPTPIQVTPSVVRHVGDCNHYDDRSAREVGLRARVVERSGEPTVQLSARDHSACIAIPIEFRPNVPSLLRLEYRTVVGAPARVCVWEEKPQRCATLPSLESAPGWHKLRAVVRGAPGSRTVLLFLYADGGGDTTTTTEYRNLSIKRGWPYEAIAIAPATPLPRVSYRRVAPYEFKAHVTNARRPFLLVAAETYAPGWRVEAKGRSSNGVEHLRVNGYANGWRIPWKGTYDITIKYGPERYAQLARRADLVLIPLSVLGWLAWRLTRRYDFPRS